MVAARSYLGNALDEQQVAEPTQQTKPDKRRDWYEEGLGAGRYELTRPYGSQTVVPITRLRDLISEWSSGPDDGWNREFISEYVRGLKDALKEDEEADKEE